MAEERPLDELRAEASDAARGLLDSGEALREALRAIRLDSERSAGAYRAVVRSLAIALAARDGYTGDHSTFVHQLASAVCARLGLDDRQTAEVEATALLHDIGKIGVPDHVLNKRGALDESEWAVMREHPVIGERILLPLPELSAVAAGIRHAHERWDGTGYPDGLAGEAIPLASRIVLACDAFNALISDRPYRAALDVTEAKAELRRHAGTQFDPAVVDALEASLDDQGRVIDAAPERAGVVTGGPVDAAAVDIRRLEGEVHALITVASAVATVETLDELVEIAAEEARQAITATSVAVSRFEAGGRLMRVLVNVGDLADWEVRRPADETYRIDDDDELRGLLLAGRSYVTSLDDPDGLAAEHVLLRALGRHSAAAVPIVLGGKTWGELWACRNAGSPVFAERDVRVLEAIAGQVAAAVGRTELFARMADLAYRDALTGVGNRRALEERMELMVAEALESGSELAVLLCDLDNLKQLNDHRGHTAGDEALQRLAETLAAGAPGPELVYRIGGDEFCLLLPGHGWEQAKALGERVLRRLAETSPGDLMASCGVASLGIGVERATDLMRAADTAQYAAKRGGRGRVYAADLTSTKSWSPPAPLASARRARRGADTEGVASRILHDALGVLDGALAFADAPARLEDLVVRLVSMLDAARGAVSRHVASSGLLEEMFVFDARRERIWRRELAQQLGDRWCADEYPATVAILDGGAFVVERDDESADAAERAVLRELGMTAVLAAAAQGPGGPWLVELYADDTASARALVPAADTIRLLVAEAARERRPPRRTSAAA
jgi:diguanylate cyclase (GGDEF)-like protein